MCHIDKKMKEKEYIPYDLILKYLSEQISENENNELQKWLKENPENYRTFEKIVELWILSSGEKLVTEPSVDDAWHKVKKSINSETSKFRVMKTSLLKYAAIILLTFSVLYYYNSDNSSKLLMNNEVVSAGSIVKYKLPDGSVVWLNNKSKLLYNNEFGDNNRLILLNGECFFDVIPNKEIPFIVKTDNSVIEVKGTSFNYRSYKKDSIDQVIVNTGIVEFSDIKNKLNKVILTKGIKAELNKHNNKLIKIVNDEINFNSWITGILTFKNEKMPKVIKSLEKHYNRSFVIKNPRKKETELTATFDNQDVKDVLEIIFLTTGLVVDTLQTP